MKDFNTSLLREKFTIHDLGTSGKDDPSIPVVAVSNRLILPLTNHLGHDGETFAVRAQTMHGCLRMAACVVDEFRERGAITDRTTPLEWGGVWAAINKGFEEKFNPGRWASLYHKGRVVFQGGPAQHHPFLDIIEQCDARNQGSYEDSILVAEDAFRQAGRLVEIEHDSNVALVMNVESGGLRCGVIVRTQQKTMTFSLTARPKAGNKSDIPQCLNASANFLEGIHLAHQIGMAKPSSPELMERLHSLKDAIQRFENTADVTYRPERPDFGKMIDSTRTFARQTT